MRSSPTAAAVDAVFDDANLIGYSGLEPVVRLAERCGLPDLVTEHVRIDDAPNSGGANAAAKVVSLVAGMVAGARYIDVPRSALRDGCDLHPVHVQPHLPGRLVVHPDQMRPRVQRRRCGRARVRLVSVPESALGIVIVQRSLARVYPSRNPLLTEPSWLIAV